MPTVLVAGVRRDRPGIEIHQSQTLLRRDVRQVQGISLTSPARTLLDCAALLTPQLRRRAVNAALRRHLVRSRQLADVIVRNPKHPGRRALAVLVDRPGNPTKSPLEDDFETFCAQHGLPRPITNTFLAGYEVDAYFPAERVIVELDSLEWHLNPEVFESDRERDAHHLALAIVTVRLTWERLHARPEYEADRLQIILAARRDQAA